MEKNKRHVCIILDMSGSMSSNKDVTISGVNEQIQQMKTDCGKNDQEIYFSLITFNGEVFETTWEQPVDETIKEITDKNYTPNGGTALNDAMGYALTKLSKISAKENDSFLVILVSDGHENSSTEFDAQKIGSLKKELEQSSKWTFTYMGCSEENVAKVASDYGLAARNCAVWSNNTSEGTSRAMRNSKKALSNFLRCNSAVASDNYYGATSTGVVNLSVEELDENSWNANENSSLKITSTN